MLCVRSQGTLPPARVRVPPLWVWVGCLGSSMDCPPPPVGVGWVVGARLVSGFVENLSTLHLR